MAGQRIAVGVIGVGPDPGRAARAHLSVLSALPAYRIAGVVAVDRPEDEGARALAERPDVDLVAVTSQAPASVAPVGTALAAGKHVYCDWPLLGTAGQTASLARAARDAGGHHAVGLLGRYAPGVAYARELIAGGCVGPVTSASLHEVRDARSPVPVELAAADSLDALQHLVGGLTEVSARLSVRHRFSGGPGGGLFRSSDPDHVLLHAAGVGGAVVSAHVHGVAGRTSRVRMEVCGSRGTLVLASAGGGPVRLRLLDHGDDHGDDHGAEAEAGDGPWRDLPVPARHGEGPAGGGRPGGAPALAALTRSYQRLAADLRSGVRTVPGLGTATRARGLIEAVRASSASGSRVTLEWV